MKTNSSITLSVLKRLQQNAEIPPVEIREALQIAEQANQTINEIIRNAPDVNLEHRVLTDEYVYRLIDLINYYTKSCQSQATRISELTVANLNLLAPKQDQIKVVVQNMQSQKQEIQRQLEDQRRATRDQYDNFQGIICKKSTEIDVLRKERDELKSQILTKEEEFQKQCKEYQQQIDEKHKEFNREKQNIQHSAQEEQIKLLAQIQQLQSEVTQSKNEITTQKAQTITLKTENSQLHERNSNLILNINQAKQEKQKLIDDLNNTFGNKKNQSGEKQQSTDPQLERLQLIQQQQAKKLLQAADATTQLIQLQFRVKSLEDELKNTKQEVLLLIKQRNKLELEASKSSTEKQELARELKYFTDQNKNQEVGQILAANQKLLQENQVMKDIISRKDEVKQQYTTSLGSTMSQIQLKKSVHLGRTMTETMDFDQEFSQTQKITQKELQSVLTRLKTSRDLKSTKLAILSLLKPDSKYVDYIDSIQYRPGEQ